MAEHLFEKHLAAAWPPEAWREVTVLVAVSGGADSVALLRGLAAVQAAGPGRLIAAHFNHRLRGAESDGDEAFVADLCGGLQLPCEIAAADAPGTSEAAAREQRFDFLTAAARRTGARYVVTAHTADDQAETILHRIVRGTGLAGLAGMPRARALCEGVSLLRPLLEFRRDELRLYLADLGQYFREDSSNRDTHFTRNRIRQDLLPQLARDYNPHVIEAILRLGALAGETLSVLESLTEEIAGRCVLRRSAETLELDCGVLSAAASVLVRETLMALWRRQGWPLQGMTHEHWVALEKLASSGPSLEAESRKAAFPGEIMVERSVDLLLLTAPREAGSPT